ncbi:MAG: hypothetical protein ACK5HU_02705 [Flavobacteriales bacterium]
MDVKKDNSKIKIELNSDESIVLLEFITRFTDSVLGDGFYESKAEELILFELEGKLEKQIDSLFSPNYKLILENARKMIIDR